MNQKLSLNPAADSSDDVAVPSDDAVRQALLRMGSGKPRGGGGQSPQQDRQHDRQHGGQHERSHGYGGNTNRRGGAEQQANSASPDARRRRFSQNEHVPVEYVSRDRPARGAVGGEPLRLDFGRAEAAEPGEDRTGFLERELERERQARSAVERTLEETRTALTAARTRVAHLEFDLNEARAQRQAMIDLAQSAAQQSQQAAEARAAAAAHTTATAGDEEDEFAPARRGRGRPRRVAATTEEDAEPEPVKWWTDD